jgi:glutamyl-tRNA reductase
VENGVKTVFVSNRNFNRAAQLADKFRGVAVPFENFMKCAIEADIVITSTGAPHYIIRTWDVAHLMPKRQGRPIIFIDIAVPRDVEPEVSAMTGVTLYNIDDLEAVVESNIKGREQEAKVAEAIVADEMAELVVKFRYLSFRPAMARLTDKAEQMRQREVKRALTKLPDITPEERKIFENMSKMLVRKLLRDPMVRVNEAAGTEQEQFYVAAICNLFKLDAIGESRLSEKKTCYRHAQQ